MLGEFLVLVSSIQLLWLSVICSLISAALLMVLVLVMSHHVQGQLQQMVVECSTRTNQTQPCCTHDELLVRNCLNQEQVQYKFNSTITKMQGFGFAPNSTAETNILLSQILHEMHTQTLLNQDNAMVLNSKLAVIGAQINQLDDLIRSQNHTR